MIDEENQIAQPPVAEFRASQVLPNLYLGNIWDSRNITELKKLGVTHIISVLDKTKHPFSNDFHYLIVEAIDEFDQQLITVFDPICEWMENTLKKGALFVHCTAGKSRSPTLVIAYLMKKKKMKLKEAQEFLNSKRKVFPNKGFLKQLKLYEENGFQFNEKIGNDLLREFTRSARFRIQRNITHRISEFQSTNLPESRKFWLLRYCFCLKSIANRIWE